MRFELKLNTIRKMGFELKLSPIRKKALELKLKPKVWLRIFTWNENDIRGGREFFSRSFSSHHFPIFQVILLHFELKIYRFFLNFQFDYY